MKDVVNRECYRCSNIDNCVYTHIEHCVCYKKKELKKL